ncbi:MAG: putative glycoside hydrolase [Anaerolineae bacterium]
MRRFLFAVISLFIVIIFLAVAFVILWHPRRVHGVVSDALTSESISGAVVQTGRRVLYSDRAGRFDLGWIYGTQTITVHGDGYLPLEVEVPEGRPPFQTLPLLISLTPTVLSGIVTDAEIGTPLAGSIVAAGHLSTVANEQGYYALHHIRTGTLLNASMPGYEPSTAVFHGQKVQDFALRPTETKVQMLDLYSGQPVSGSLVICGSDHFMTDASGTVVIKRLHHGSLLSIQADGYAAVEYQYSSGDTASILLRPNTLRGVVRDSTDKHPLADVEVTLLSAGEEVTSTLTDADGQYAFRDLPPSLTLVAAAVDYDRFEAPVGPVTEMDVYLKRFEVRGIYMPLGILTSEQRVRELIELVERTELNTIVVDVKNDRGWLAYPSAEVKAQQSGAYQPRVMDIKQFLALCKEKGIYTIARLVVFKDSTLATAYPELAVHKPNGDLWTDFEGSAWLDPFLAEVQDYNIAIAKEVALLGFDELQFDYLRFPSDGNVREIIYSQESTLESRCKAINEFCARLRDELKPCGVLLSADVFGLTVWVAPEEDMGIGQRVIDIAPYMDYISPMLYPATFISGNLGYDNPLLYPYEVVYRSCIELAKRTQTRIRPWLQHYSWNNVVYGAKEMRLQKQAAADAKTYGWMFWNAAGKYDAKSFDSVTKE